MKGVVCFDERYLGPAIFPAMPHPETRTIATTSVSLRMLHPSQPRTLDGSRIMTPAAILWRLEKGFELLAGGARDRPERHQTMRHAH